MYGIDLGSYYAPLLHMWDTAKAAWNAAQEQCREFSIHSAAAQQYERNMDDAVSAGMVNDRRVSAVQFKANAAGSAAGSTPVGTHVGSGAGLLSSGSGRSKSGV